MYTLLHVLAKVALLKTNYKHVYNIIALAATDSHSNEIDALCFTNDNTLYTSIMPTLGITVQQL